MTRVLIAAAAVYLSLGLTGVVRAQDSAAGAAIFSSYSCDSCHSLSRLRTDIANYAPSGLSYAKALTALNTVVNTGVTQGGVNASFMATYSFLSVPQRQNLAAYIAGVAVPAPVVTFPVGGLVIGATGVGSATTGTVDISNTGTADLVFGANGVASIASGGDAADFQVSTNTCPTMTLTPNSGQKCNVGISFRPSAGGASTRTASLGITYTTGVVLMPLQGSVSASSNAASPAAGSAATAPGGGGSLTWQWGLLLLLALALRAVHNCRTTARAVTCKRPL